MKIGIIGAGIFGMTTAIKLAELGHQVEVFEKQKDIMTSASNINQYRLHKGYHYPRSKKTAISCKTHVGKFSDFYSEAVIHDTDQYYCISKRKSLITSTQYLEFCDELKLYVVRKINKSIHKKR